MTHRPPRLPRLALKVLVPPERLEDVEGDLLELFHDRLRTSGWWHAHLMYRVDAVSVLRRVPPPFFPSLPIIAALKELRYSARGLAKRPGYASVAAFTLALGIGSSLTIFTVLNAVLLRPLPYPESDRIVEIVHHAPGMNMPELRSSPGLTERYRQSARTLVHVGGYHARQLNVSGS